MVCNLTGREANIQLPENMIGGNLLITNYDDTLPGTSMNLRPWEAFAALQED